VLPNAPKASFSREASAPYSVALKSSSKRRVYIAKDATWEEEADTNPSHA
jgi:hypothetical protein